MSYRLMFMLMPQAIQTINTSSPRKHLLSCTIALRKKLLVIVSSMLPEMENQE